jgi:hypothetical protein
MPRHQQVTACRRSGGPVSKHCTCEHCTLSMCAVCGAYEGGLTTDCPGTKVDFDKQREIYETPLDYTDVRGWHQGIAMEHRVPRFTTTRLSPEPLRVDSRSVVAPLIDWTTIDRSVGLQHELALRAIAWVLADRDCDDLAAVLARAEEEADGPISAMVPGDRMRVGIEGMKIDFQRTYRLVEERDDAFRQAAHTLVTVLEESQGGPPTLPCRPTSNVKPSGTLPEIQLVRTVLRALGISQATLAPETRVRAAEAARLWMSRQTGLTLKERLGYKP